MVGIGVGVAVGMAVGVLVGVAVSNGVALGAGVNVCVDAGAQADKIRATKKKIINMRFIGCNSPFNSQCFKTAPSISLFGRIL